MKIEDNRQIEFAVKTHDYVFQSIVQADTKAATTIGVNSAVIIACFAAGSHNYLSWDTLALGLLPAFSFTLLFIGQILSGLALAPRLSTSEPLKNKPVVFWGSVSKMSKADYVNSVQGSNVEEFCDALLAHAFELSIVCSKKFKWAQLGYWFTLVGGFLAALSLSEIVLVPA